MTTTFVVPLIHRLHGGRQVVRIEARDPAHAIESAQEIHHGWSAQFPIRREEEWR